MNGLLFVRPYCGAPVSILDPLDTAIEVQSLGYSGLSAVRQAFGISISTLRKGIFGLGQEEG